MKKTVNQQESAKRYDLLRYALEGEQMMQSPKSNNTHDTNKAKQLEQQLVSAPEEMTQAEIAGIKASLADMLDDSEKDRKLQLYKEAADVREYHDNCIAGIFRILLTEKNPTVPDEIYDVLDQTEKEIADRCNALFGKAKKPEGFISRLFNGTKNTKASDLYENVMMILDYAGKKPETVSSVLLSLKDRIVRELNIENSVRLIRRIQTSGLPEDVMNQIIEEYLLGSDAKLRKLRNQYEGQEADDLLEFYEKAVAVLHAIGDERSGAIAGNIAVVYRQRKEKEKMYKYHLLSKTIYEEAGKTYDSLIESVNLATAYSEFGETEKAIAELRSCLSAATENKEDRIAASAAGNLAAILMKHGGNSQEIRTCFEIEESYFEKMHEYRDLAVSLYNQILWNMQRTDPDMVNASIKFRQFKKIVQEHHLQEFYKPMQETELLLLFS